MKMFVPALIALGFGASMAAAQTSSSGVATFSNSTNCRVLQLKPGEGIPAGSLATPSASLPTASAGRPRAAETAGPSATTSSLPDGSRMVTDSSGGCTIYRNGER